MQGVAPPLMVLYIAPLVPAAMARDEEGPPLATQYRSIAGVAMML